MFFHAAFVERFFITKFPVGLTALQGAIGAHAHFHKPNSMEKFVRKGAAPSFALTPAKSLAL